MSPKEFCFIAIVLATSCDQSIVFGVQGDGPVFQDPADLGPFQTCTVLTHVNSASGVCLTEWSCQDEGVLILSCSLGDGGAGCACSDDSGNRMLAATPASCADVEGLSMFASKQCGWGPL
jgi:hypothetical protein